MPGRCLFIVALLLLNACGAATTESESSTQSESGQSDSTLPEPADFDPALSDPIEDEPDPTDRAVDSADDAGGEGAEAQTALPTAAPVPASLEVAEPTPPAEPTGSPEPASPEPSPPEPTVPEPTAVPDQSCRVIDDFSTTVTGWQVVLDGVMGGLSSGQASIDNGVLQVTGTINTNGGGFVMVRRQIDPSDLDGATSLRFVADTDGRGYEVIVDDALPGRNRSVSHFATIEFVSADSNGLATGTVVLADLEPRSFGNPISTEPFRPDLAFSIGVILADGIDGDFVIRLDHIQACA